jgi:hypothetical protein
LAAVDVLASAELLLQQMPPSDSAASSSCSNSHTWTPPSQSAFALKGMKLQLQHQLDRLSFRSILQQLPAEAIAASNIGVVSGCLAPPSFTQEGLSAQPAATARALHRRGMMT